jgi:hypothetical protein
VGEGGEGRRAARLLAQSGAGHPEDGGGADRVEVQLPGVDLQVGSLGAAVEVQREVVRREDLAERDGSRVRGDRGDPAVVDAELLQRPVQIAAERVVARAGDDGRGKAEPGGRDRDIGGRPAEKLAEGLNLRQGYTGLQGIEIDPDAAHRDQIETRD